MKRSQAECVKIRDQTKFNKTKSETKQNIFKKTSTLVALYKIRAGCGGRHFDRDTVSPEMFIWLHLINTLDWMYRGPVVPADT